MSLLNISVYSDLSDLDWFFRSILFPVCWICCLYSVWIWKYKKRCCVKRKFTNHRYSYIYIYISIYVYSNIYPNISNRLLILIVWRLTLQITNIQCFLYYIPRHSVNKIRKGTIKTFCKDRYNLISGINL